MGLAYCVKDACVRENREPMVVVEIAQTKTNAEYKLLDEQTLRDVREGRYRRDPVVVKRESRNQDFDVPKLAFKKPKAVKAPGGRVRFVQALQAQGYGVDDILQKGAYMGLTRSEVVKYMTARKQ
jgi:hypothetical protein